ncbi:MAG: glycerophosphodiester phosphodiesterase [Bacteroidaceae bacterium]|nr:glycerophosphodiester phosphodiesterase [Bacteroidaceae bacterium]
MNLHSRVIFSLALLGLMAAVTDMDAKVKVKFKPIEPDNHVIQIFAHRAGRFEFDENTMDGFRKSYAAGNRGFETDIRFNKDEEIVLNHDESLKRTFGIDRECEDMTNDEIKAIRNPKGNPLAFCSELADFLQDKPNMYVEWEIKTIKRLYDEARLERLCEKAYNEIIPKKHPTSEYLFTSFDVRALKIMHRLHPDVPLMLLKSKPVSKEIAQEALDMGIYRLGCRVEGTTQKDVKAVREMGIKVVSLWPCASKEEFMLAAALGADAINQDRPMAMTTWLKKGLPQQKIKGFKY